MKTKQSIHVKQRKKSALIFFLFPIIVFCSSCKDSDATDEEFNPNNPIEVTAIIPETGTIALPVVIHGKNFGTDKSKIKVFFDDVQAPIITAQNEHLYVSTPKQDGGKHTIKVTVENQEGILENRFTYIVTSSISTVAGTGERGIADGDALEATFASPEYIAVDDKGNLIVSDYSGSRLRLVSLNESKVTTLVSNGDTYEVCFSLDYSTLHVSIESNSQLGNEFDCTANWLRTVVPNDLEMEDGASAVTTDQKGNAYYIGFLGAIARKDINTGKITQIGEIPKSLIDTEVYYGGADYYSVYNPRDNYIYVSTRWEHVIIRFEAKEILEEKDFEIYAGQIGESGLYNSTRLESTFNAPRGMAFDSKGNMYVVDSRNNVVRMINPEGKVSTFIGNPRGGLQDGAVEEALFFAPYDIAISPDDIIYISDGGNYRIRCITIQ